MSKNAALRKAREWLAEADWVGTCSCNASSRKPSHTEEAREEWCMCYGEYMNRLRTIDKAIKEKP